MLSFSQENFMQKILFSTLISIFLIFGFTVQKTNALPNPWVNCGSDYSCAVQKAGFIFSLNVKNYSVRAMKDMIEIRFPLDAKRNVTARKSQRFEGRKVGIGINDISGDYSTYPVNKIIELDNGALFFVRGNKKKFFVANFEDETGFYSFTCNSGLKVKDIKYLYKLIMESKAQTQN